MELKNILNQIQRPQQNKVEAISIEPHIDRARLRHLFIGRLNEHCLSSSNGLRGLILDKESEFVIEKVCQYLNNEKDFESEEGFSLKKGLMIAGNFGSGKTQLMKTYKDVKSMLKMKVGFQSCVDMNMRFLKKDEFTNKTERFDGIKTFSNKFDSQERIFDDLGEEETTVLDYGNRVCVMAHILSERYKGLKEGCITHVTTNLTKEQIGKVYGGRIESRMFEMFNILNLGSTAESVDYRKINK